MPLCLTYVITRARNLVAKNWVIQGITFRDLGTFRCSKIQHVHVHFHKGSVENFDTSKSKGTNKNTTIYPKHGISFTNFRSLTVEEILDLGIVEVICCTKAQTANLIASLSFISILYGKTRENRIIISSAFPSNPRSGYQPKS